MLILKHLLSPSMKGRPRVTKVSPLPSVLGSLQSSFLLEEPHDGSLLRSFICICWAFLVAFLVLLFVAGCWFCWDGAFPNLSGGLNVVFGFGVRLTLVAFFRHCWTPERNLCFLQLQITAVGKGVGLVSVPMHPSSSTKVRVFRTRLLFLIFPSESPRFNEKTKAKWASEELKTRTTNLRTGNRRNVPLWTRWRLSGFQPRWRIWNDWKCEQKVKLSFFSFADFSKNKQWNEWCRKQRNSPSSSLLSGSGFLIRRLFFFSVFSSSLSDSARLVLLREAEIVFHFTFSPEDERVRDDLKAFFSIHSRSWWRLTPPGLSLCVFWSLRRCSFLLLFGFWGQKMLLCWGRRWWGLLFFQWFFWNKKKEKTIWKIYSFLLSWRFLDVLKTGNQLLQHERFGFPTLFSYFSKIRKLKQLPVWEHDS